MEEKQNLKEIAYQEIRRRIVECTFEPNSMLSEDMLQKELGISRTPIREALVSLQHEGLVTILPKKGILVSNFTISDLCYTYEIRLLTEPYLIRTYAAKINKEILVDMRQKHLSLLTRLRQGYSYEGQKELYILDDAFHEMFFSICENPYIQNVYQLIKALCQRQRIMLGKIVDTRVISTIEEHLEVLELTINGEYEEAAIEMEKHLKKSQKASIKTIVDNPLLTRF